MPVRLLWFGSDPPGFCLGTSSLIISILLIYALGIQANLSLGPGGEFPRFRGKHILKRETFQSSRSQE